MMILSRICTIDEVDQVIKDFLPYIKEGTLIQLTGDLGSGKTYFVQRLAKFLNINGPIKSPTFTIVKSYPFKLNDFQGVLHHMDAYRLEDSDDFALFEDVFNNENGISIVEWPIFVKDEIDQSSLSTIHVKINYTDDMDERQYIIE